MKVILLKFPKYLSHTYAQARYPTSSKYICSDGGIYLDINELFASIIQVLNDDDLIWRYPLLL